MLLATLLLFAAPSNVTTLPPGEGKAIVQRTCVSCHALKVVTAKKASKEEWSVLVDQMVSRGADLNDDEIEIVVDYLAKKDLQDLVLVSPDAGGVERARAIAKRLNAGLAIIDKRRDGPNVALFMYLIGDVKNKDVVVIDDMIDTAGTLIQAVEAVKREGARRVLACAVHGVLSGPALKRIEESPLEEVIITNSVPLTPGKASPKVHVLSVAPLLAEAIRRIHDEESVSTLFV